MINYETILSTFDDKLTLMQWLQKVEEALQGAGLERVDITQVTPTTAVFKFTFADGTSLTTPSITLPRGPKGDTGATGATGATGNGISSITKTGTSGLIDTYTVLYTNGTTDTFTVTNGADGAEGNGIASIEKTSTVGLVDTYTVTYTDGDTMTYTVTNGADGTMEVIDIGTVTTSGQTIALTKAQYDKLTASGVTCLVKLTYLSNDYYMQRNYEGGGYYHYGDRFIASAGGYVDFNVTIYQSGADYEAQFTITNALIVNPTLAGTETALSGLQINGTKYKIDAGGEQLYLHIITMNWYSTPKYACVTCFIINNSSTELTNNTISAYLVNKNFDGGANRNYFATGVYYSDASTSYPIVAITGGSQKIYISYIIDNTSGIQVQNISTGIQIKDVVITL